MGVCSTESMLSSKSLGTLIVKLHNGARPNHTGILTHQFQIKEQVYLVARFHFQNLKHIHFTLWSVADKNDYGKFTHIV